jgi:glycerophosphoryl diester phosphodiesterase
MAKIKRAGLQVLPWTVNQPEDIAAMIDLGVDGVITDFPERVPKN